MARKKGNQRIRYRNPKKVIGICSWCGKRISPDSEIFSLGAKLRQGVEIEEGKAIDLSLPTRDKVISAIVLTSDSEAKREGSDLLFVICSDACGQALRQALQAELDFIV